MTAMLATVASLPVPRSTRAFPLAAIQSAFFSLPRPVLAYLIDCLIDRLDQLDGDPDLEDDDATEDEARDDGCGRINLGNRLVYGSDHYAEEDC